MPSIEQLTRYYASISDDELSRVLTGGRSSYTEDAWSVITAEAARRDRADPQTAGAGAVTTELSEAERALFTAIAEYGATCDEGMIRPLMAQYSAAIEELSEEQRLNLMVALIDLIENQRISPDALNPFLFVDPSQRVISSAALHYACVYPSTTADEPLFGVRELVGFAKSMIDRGEESRAVSVVIGLLLIGDRRVVERLRHVWRMFSPEGRQELLCLRGVRVYAPVLDWMIDWLEDSERDEFGLVAAAFVRMSQLVKAEGVVETRRAIPIWSAPSIDKVVTLVAEWTFSEFGERIRPRLEQLAQFESEPRIMPDVMAVWGVGGLDEIPAAFRGASAHRDNDLPVRDLLSLLPSDARRQSAGLRAIALSDAELLAAGGQTLLLWGIFNPYGPTLSAFALAQTGDPDVEVLVYRMLNPFRQDTIALATVVGSEQQRWTEVRSIVRNAFQRNLLAAPDSETLALVTCAQTLVYSIWDSDPSDHLIEQCFTTSPGVLGDPGLKRWLEWEARHHGDPWAHAGEARDTALQAFLVAQRTGENPEPPAEPPITERLPLAAEWWKRVRDPEHWVPTLLQFPNAWAGAIGEHYRQVSPPERLEAYPFDRVDEFLERFNLPLFRVLRERAAEARGQSSGNE